LLPALLLIPIALELRVPCPEAKTARVQHEVITLRLENQQKEATVVDPLLFHALSFCRRAGCFEHSDLLTVTSVGVPYGANDSEGASTTSEGGFGQQTFPQDVRAEAVVGSVD